MRRLNRDKEEVCETKMDSLDRWLAEKEQEKKDRRKRKLQRMEIKAREEATKSKTPKVSPERRIYRELSAEIGELKVINKVLRQRLMELEHRTPAGSSWGELDGYSQADNC